MKNSLHIYDINGPTSRHIINKRIISVWWHMYVLSNSKQHLKLSSWEKSAAYIKSVYGFKLKQGCGKYLSNWFLPKEKGKVICEQYGTMAI